MDSTFPVLKARDGRKVEDVDEALANELGTTTGRVMIMKIVAQMIGLVRIPTLPDQQLDAEFELELNRAHPGIKGGGAVGLRGHKMIDEGTELQLRGRTVLKRIAELYQE